MLTVHGAHPAVAILVCMLGGAAAGLVTAVLHLKLRLNVLLASILVATAAYSVCLIVMGTGKRLFRDERATAKLRLIESTPTSTGVVIARYEPAR